MERYENSERKSRQDLNQLFFLQSTYCATMQRHAADNGRVIEVANLDPAAEVFDYQPLVDIRELIHLDDAMQDEDLHYGPNGGLVFCLEYLIENSTWLHDQLCGGSDNEGLWVL